MTPGGSKLWYFAYRFTGLQKKLAIGGYPAISLAKARQSRDAAKALFASEIDPGQQKKLNNITKANSEANTFEAISLELLAKKRREGKVSNTIGKRE